MTTFDLLLRGGTVIDGSSGPGVRAELGFDALVADVVVNGRPAILAGVETGDRPARLLRRP
ncbi:MAG: hypothetical protein ABI553_09210 [Chloroflexota bacterium]